MNLFRTFKSFGNSLFISSCVNIKWLFLVSFSRFALSFISPGIDIALQILAMLSFHLPDVSFFFFTFNILAYNAVLFLYIAQHCFSASLSDFYRETCYSTPISYFCLVYLNFCHLFFSSSNTCYEDFRFDNTRWIGQHKILPSLPPPSLTGLLLQQWLQLHFVCHQHQVQAEQKGDSWALCSGTRVLPRKHKRVWVLLPRPCNQNYLGSLYRKLPEPQLSLSHRDDNLSVWGWSLHVIIFYKLPQVT